MAENITLTGIEKNLEPFRLMCDAMRLIDPINKRVIASLNGNCGDHGEKSSAYWKNALIYDNCISLRAFQDNTFYVKLEQTADTIIMVTALPINGAETPLVLELFKNVSDSLMIGNGDYSDGQFVQNLIQDMNDLAYKDETTKIYNRRYVDERLPKDIIKAESQKSPISIIFLDVDNLKQINDTFGHALGDKVLKEVSVVLMHSIRTDTDWVARYGGDEFLICLYNTGSEEANLIAERIRNKISGLIILQNEKIGTTASLGVTSMEGAHLSADELISSSDQKMYLAKKKGKNCTIFS